jgi:serine/threonine protein kinase
VHTSTRPVIDGLSDPALAEFADIVAIRPGRLATVYRARDLATGRPVALKVLDVHDAPPPAVEAFERESTVLSTLGAHPNIVSLYRRITLDDGRPVLVLELCDGSLADRLRREPRVSTREAVAIGIKIAGALETAHRGGVLHRDVRPENILLTAFGDPALSDFGVAILHSVARPIPALFEFATPHTAPELIEGGLVTAATDVYGLASTLYELVAGAPAFPEYQDESRAALCLRILRDTPPPIISPTVPLDLSDVLLWALAKNVDSRPPSPAWLAAELTRVATHQRWARTRLIVRESARPVGQFAVT